MIPFRRRNEDQLNRIEEAVRSVEHKNEMMQTVLMIREPDSAIAADAFTGLRKQVASTAKHHWTHMAQLAEMDVALKQARTLEEVGQLVTQWLSMAGIVRIAEPPTEEFIEAFDLVADEGPHPVVVQPAYIDQATGRVIKNGRLEMTERQPHSVPAAPPDVPAPGSRSDSAAPVETQISPPTDDLAGGAA